MLPVQEAVNSSVCSMSIDAIRSVNTSSTPKIRLSQNLILYSGSEYDQSCQDPETWESEEELPPHQGKVEHCFQNKKFHNAWHKWLCSFFSSLGMSSVRYKKVAIRLQHANQVKILLDY